MPYTPVFELFTPDKFHGAVLINKSVVAGLKLVDRSLTSSLFPAFKSWIPTYTNLTVGNGTIVARFNEEGNRVIGYWELVFGSTSSIDGTNPMISLPVTATSLYTFPRHAVGPGQVFDTSGGATFPGVVRLESATQFSIAVFNAAATYLSNRNLTATVPMTWATGDILSGTFVFEGA